MTRPVPHELNIKHGLIMGAVAGAVAFAVPWLLMSLITCGDSVTKADGRHRGAGAAGAVGQELR